MKILDILLYPKSVFAKIADKKITLFLGILLVGIIDTMVTLGITKLPMYFTGTPKSLTLFNFSFPEFLGGIPTALVFNYFYAIILIIVLGSIDIFFFSIPLYDFSKVLARKFKFEHSGSMIKVAKIYALTHLVIIPITIAIILLAEHYKLGESSNALLVYPVQIYLEILMPIWFTAVITRGVNVIYNVNMRFKGLVFLGIYLWNYLLGVALGIVNGYLIGLFIK